MTTSTFFSINKQSFWFTDYTIQRDWLVPDTSQHRSSEWRAYLTVAKKQRFNNSASVLLQQRRRKTLQYTQDGQNTNDKKFWKAASLGSGFFTGDNVMRHRPVGSIAVACSSRAVMPLLRTKWSVYVHTAVTRSAFSVSRKIPKLSLCAWFIGPTRVSPQTASRSVQLFLHSTPVWPTRRQTDTQTTLRATLVEYFATRPEKYNCAKRRRHCLNADRWRSRRTFSSWHVSAVDRTDEKQALHDVFKDSKHFPYRPVLGRSACNA